MLEDVEGNHEIFKREEQSPEQPMQLFAPAADAEDSFVRYQVNLFINNEKTEGAPVVIEPFPFYYSLFVKI